MLGIDGTVKKNRMAVHPLVERGRGQLAEREPRMGLLAAANVFGGRLQRPGVQPAFSAHHQRRRHDQELHRLPSLEENDNNAWMTQLLGFGTGTVNFFGRYAYVGEGREGLHAVIWTEPEEPQAVIGSHLQSDRLPGQLPETSRARCESQGSLRASWQRHSGHLVLRGEYLYTANGPGGFEVFDVANIDQKGFSERIVSAPVSPLGQRTCVHTKYATSVALPSTLALDPARVRLPGKRRAADRSVLRLRLRLRSRGRTRGRSNVATLVDGNPDNNFLKQAMSFQSGWCPDRRDVSSPRPAIVFT